MTLPYFIATAAGALAAAWAAVYALGALRWSRVMHGLHARLRAAAEAPAVAHVDHAALHGLPPPVALYLRRVLADGAPVPSAVRMRHRGRFELAGATPRWSSFTSSQRVLVGRPAFAWNGRIAVAPGVPVRVHDAYVGGEGLLRAAMLGLVDVARLQGGGALAEGELMRWLAESPWYPEALLPGNGVSWTALDANTARATVADGDTRASIDVRFGEDGLIAGVHADARGRTVGDRIVPTPWLGRFGAYERRGGVLVPTEGEVAWCIDGVERPYWRGRLAALRRER